MKRAAFLTLLMTSACASMEPKYAQPDPAIPTSWPAGDPYLRQSEALLPSITYRQIFQDRRLQSLIDQALANNRDLAVAAANIAVARERYRIQRAEQFPEVDARAGTTVSGGQDNSKVSADFSAGVGVPNFEIDLFGRLRSLSNAERNRYFASEAGARATRLALVADVASAWINAGADVSLLRISEQTAVSAEKSVRLTRLRLEGGVAPRTDLRQAEQILAQAQADLARQRSGRAQTVNLLRLLVGAEIDPALLPGSIEEAAGGIAELPAGLDSYVLLRRPDVVQAEYQLRAANAEIGAARAALFPRITLTGLLGVASTALGELLTGGNFGGSLSGDLTYPIFNAGASRANVRLTEAQRTAAVATYQRTVQTAFREVADALARRGTINDEVAANQRKQAATADTYLLTEARYREGIDSFLNSLDAQRSYYLAQVTLVQARLVAAQTLIDLYEAVGGDPFLQSAPVCQSLPEDSSASSANVASQCSPI